ncbi:uncharacterized protein DS421_9g286480 [Arachis hypogaea]|nr:uncharacterized protein DS421_9g286480 [Arachis hypogaea]
MEERRRGCSVATEIPPLLLGFVAIAVLPPSGCCAAAEELEEMSRRHHALSPSRCVVTHLFFTIAAHHHRRILCHQFEGGHGFDNDDELQWLIEIEKSHDSDVISVLSANMMNLIQVDAERAYHRNALVILEKLYTEYPNLLGVPNDPTLLESFTAASSSINLKPWYAHAIAEAIMRTANFSVPLKVSFGGGIGSLVTFLIQLVMASVRNTTIGLDAFKNEGSLNVQAGTAFVDFKFIEEINDAESEPTISFDARRSAGDSNGHLRTNI